MSALTDMYLEMADVQSRINNEYDTSETGPLTFRDVLLLSIAHRLFDIAAILEGIRTEGLDVS